MMLISFQKRKRWLLLRLGKQNLAFKSFWTSEFPRYGFMKMWTKGKKQDSIGVFDFKAMDNLMRWFFLLFFFSRLATPSIVQPYCWLLKFYKENKEVTNHAIIKMLHRVAVDLKTPSMLFQLSLFGSFQKILSDPAASHYKASLHFIAICNMH